MNSEEFLSFFYRNLPNGTMHVHRAIHHISEAVQVSAPADVIIRGQRLEPKKATGLLSPYDAFAKWPLYPLAH
jgi:hypothetical protein